MIAIIAAASIVSSASAQVKSFAGSWKIVKERSDFGNIDPKVAAPELMTLKEIQDSIAVSRKFDGKESVWEGFMLNAPDVEIMLDKNTLKIARAYFDKKEKKLVFKGTYEVNGAQFVYWRTESWKLVGQELQIERTTVLSDKVDRVKAVYVKAN